MIIILRNARFWNYRWKSTLVWIADELLPLGSGGFKFGGEQCAVHGYNRKPIYVDMPCWKNLDVTWSMAELPGHIPF